MNNHVKFVVVGVDFSSREILMKATFNLAYDRGKN